MTASIETSIWLALRSRVETLPPAYSKAWPGETFEVPHSNGLPQPFLRIGRVTVAPVRRLIADGKPHERTGALMITVVHPLGQSISVSDQIAGMVAERFKDGSTMRHGNVCVTVPDYPHVGEGYLEGAYWETTVRIPWRCFA